MQCMLLSLTEYSVTNYGQTVEVCDFLPQAAMLVDAFGDHPPHPLGLLLQIVFLVQSTLVAAFL